MRTLLLTTIIIFSAGRLSANVDSLSLLFESGKYERLSEVAFEILDTAKSDSLKGVACKHLGNTFSKLNEFDKALKYYDLSLKYDFQSVTLSNIGLVYYFSGDYDRANQYYDSAISTANDENVKAIALNNKIVIEIEQENYDQALNLLEEVQDVFQDLNDSANYITTIFNKAEIYMEMDSFKKSDSIFKFLLNKFEKEKNYPSFKENVYYNLFILNLKQKNIDSAYHYHLAWEELTNELTGESVQKQLAEQEQAYENKILKLENRQKSFRLKATIWGSVGLVLVIILGVYLLYSYRENKRLRMVKVFADRWENESQKIAGWLIHELGQRVMAMRFMYQSRNDQLLEVADEGLEMLNTMSDHLYNMGLEGSGLKVILEGLVENHREVHQTEIELKFDGIRNLQHVHNEVKIYTILRDLLGAVVKHEKIKIHLSHTDRTQITVSLEREAEVIKAILEPRVIGAGKISVNKNTINLFIK
ncbi:tetratricopeptide repeat protein [bacterium SCSIO 12741]|nr:tetratricopeptide repeat protein [bacterium SCSIO 12741]